VKKPALTFFLFLTVIAAADFQAGLDAYNRGDFAAALKEWQPLAQQNDANSQYNLGLLYARGQGVPQDYKQAIAWYQKAAEQGVPAAEYNLGVMYANGQGVPANAAEASKWFLKAAQQGVGGAATGLATIYSEGDGAFKNYAEAAKWYRTAADEGIASAAFSLGVMYDVGQGVQQNYAEALKLYRQAADAGYASAMTNIAILYYNGQGVKRDLVQSYVWFTRAQKLNDPRAKDMIGMAAEKLKPAQIKQALADVDTWQPSTKPPQVVEAKLFKPPVSAPENRQQNAGADRIAAAGAAAAAAAGAPKPAYPAVWTGVARVVAIGDIHGDYEQFVQVLASARLIDGTGNWTGGKTHLVQTGDILDRGPDSRAVMDLLIKLEKQAALAGGVVHCLIGNHEAMNVYGDLRYVSPGEFAAFANQTAPGKAGSYAQGNTAPATLQANPAAVQEQTAGLKELRAAFGPEGEYGKWLRGQNAVVKIDRTLFVHAGLGPKFADWDIGRINDEVRRELTDFTRLHGGIVTDEEGPLWYRGLAKGDEQQLAPLVDQLLKSFDVDRIVVGHAYAGGAVTPRFNGKVIMVDTGISRVYDNIGKVACLEIDKGEPVALHRGQKLALPKDEDGADMLRYLKAAAALDPQPSPLAARIEKLEKK
jgi:TPR repeat protein